MKDIDIILGINWLQMTNPLIDWSTPRIVFTEGSEISTIAGTWMESTVPVGQVSVLRSFVHPAHPFLSSPTSAVSVLARPSFWSYAPSSNVWARSSPPGGVPCATLQPSKEDQLDQSDQAPQGQTTSEQAPQGQSSGSQSDRTKIKTTIRVQGRPVQQTKTRASQRRSMMTARGMNKMLKKGETVFLGVVRRTGDIEKKKKKEKGKGTWVG